MYDYCIEKSNNTFVNWHEKVEPFKYDMKMNYFDILVPTSDTSKFKEILKILVNANNHVLFSG